VEQVFYFGYDQKAWTHQQILFEIAMRLLGWLVDSFLNKGG
jgi:hypothetical protein